MKVNWDDDIPNIWKVIQVMFQSPPTRYGPRLLSSGCSPSTHRHHRLWVLLIALGGGAKTQAAIRHAAAKPALRSSMWFCCWWADEAEAKIWGFYYDYYVLLLSWLLHQDYEVRSHIFVRRQATTAVPFPNLVEIFLKKNWP